MAGPTFPRTHSTRSAEIARMRWHWAAEVRSRPLLASGSITISDRKRRIVVVSGTTWITLGEASRVRCAVATTAGWRKPVSIPAGTPRSRSTTSPEVGIEPGDFVGRWVRAQVLPDTVLAEPAHGKCNRFSDRRTQLARQPLQLLMGAAIDANAGAVHAIQHTGLAMSGEEVPGRLARVPCYLTATQVISGRSSASMAQVSPPSAER